MDLPRASLFHDTNDVRMCGLTIHSIAQVILGMFPFNLIYRGIDQHALVKNISPMVNLPQPMGDGCWHDVFVLERLRRLRIDF